MSRTGRTGGGGGGGGADTFETKEELSYTDGGSYGGEDMLSMTGSVVASAFIGLIMNPKTYDKSFVIPPDYNASFDGGLGGITLGENTTITVSSGSDLRIV